MFIQRVEGVAIPAGTMFHFPPRSGKSRPELSCGLHVAWRLKVLPGWCILLEAREFSIAGRGHQSSPTRGESEKQGELQ